MVHHSKIFTDYLFNILKHIFLNSLECGSQPADIVFVLDSSASEGSSNFQKQVDFVRDFAYQFAIGPQDVQVLILKFLLPTE
jgi:hypothetical protein